MPDVSPGWGSGGFQWQVHKMNLSRTYITRSNIEPPISSVTQSRSLQPCLVIVDIQMLIWQPRWFCESFLSFLPNKGRQGGKHYQPTPMKFSRDFCQVKVRLQLVFAVSCLNQPESQPQLEHLPNLSWFSLKTVLVRFRFLVLTFKISSKS